MSIQPNVLFLLMDGLRADRVYGDRRTAITPAIDALRSQGTSLLQMVSTTSTTTPSVASLMTGLFTIAHGIRTLQGYKLANRRTLAETFHEAGYYTRAEVSGPLLPSLGMGRGFDEYVYRSEQDYLDQPWGGDFMKKLAKGQFQEPWFLFLHLWELHVLWEKRWPVMRRVSRPFNHPRFGKSSYDRALSQLDVQIGKLLALVDPQRTLIVLTSDHGENIFHSIQEENFVRREHRLKPILPWHRKARQRPEEQCRSLGIGHGFHLYEDLIRIPCILTGCPFPTNHAIPNLVRQIDIFPTLIDALSLMPPEDLNLHGRSLVPLLHGQTWKDHPAYLEAVGPSLSNEKDWLAGIRTPQYKFIFGPNNPEIPEELYDLMRDPHETHSLLQEQPVLAGELKAQLLSLREAEHPPCDLSRIRMNLEEETAIRKQLESLGYLD
jgi:arylsulfatase A-like enzyme